MFSNSRDPRGRYTLLMAGIASLVLAGLLPFPLASLGFPPAPLAIPLFVTGIALIAAWWSKRRADRYDLSRLWEEKPPEPEEPYEDTVPEADESAPYCGWCDEVYAPGVAKCLRCGRDL